MHECVSSVPGSENVALAVDEPPSVEVGGATVGVFTVGGTFRTVWLVELLPEPPSLSLTTTVTVYEPVPSSA